MRLTFKNLYFFWAFTRLWVILSGYHHIPYPQADFLFSDVRLYDWWAGNILDGHFPINDPMWQYPPLAAVIFAAGYAIAHETVGFVFLAALADFVLMHLFVSNGKRHNNVHPATLWVLAPVAMGPIFLGRFDVFPTLVVCVALFAANKPAKFGAWIAVGAILKVWPVLGLLAIPRRDFRKATMGFTASAIALLIALHLWWNDSLNFIQGQRSRGLQIESLGALPYMWKNAGSGSVTSNFQYGAIEVVAPGTGLISLFISAVFLLFIIFMVAQRLSGRLDGVAPSHVLMLIVLMSMLTSRVLSPQYNLWILGLLAMCAFDPMKHFRELSMLIMVTAVCGQMLYPWLYLSFQEGGVLATSVHTLRIICLIAATALLWQSVFTNAHRRDHSPQATPVAD